jgi:hypothetical protein
MTEGGEEMYYYSMKGRIDETTCVLLSVDLGVWCVVFGWYGTKYWFYELRDSNN